MPRLPSPFRRSRADPGPEGAEAAVDETLPGRDPVPVLSARTMRREFKALLERREIDIRDLGGLVLEMVRRDRFRAELLTERAEDILAVEDRIRALDVALNSPSPARRSGGASCRCGTALEVGARFCWRCGRTVQHAMPLVPCRDCRHSLPADASYCPSCGAPTTYEEDVPDATLVRRPGGDE
jgi:Double zinc ribbon